MYQLTSSTSILRLSDNAHIPADPANTDFAAYQQWLAEGNTPEPADPVLPQVPQQVTRAQGKVVLIQMGLWPQVVAYVDAIQDPIQKAIAEVAVYETLHWQRNSPFLNQAASALGITQEQMDQLFVTASEVML